MGFGELLGWQTYPHWEGDAPQFHGDRSSYAQDPPRPHAMYVFIWLFMRVLYHVL